MWYAQARRGEVRWRVELYTGLCSVTRRRAGCSDRQASSLGVFQNMKQREKKARKTPRPAFGYMHAHSTTPQPKKCSDVMPLGAQGN